ncbi:hypothetical protein HNR44_001142 [Geomicrobium halophilum]|uniref:Cyclic-phosphate processing Receiver domain-containing protein n=1 Tax=Geomicrobium halophilum TaxID=549000 RepID=A0A841PXJ3_9BACL|nr:cyclic-phosphate processing receiver domain-containing protein [Geomicrobium halophilum]MBB6449193.1 hypothetical protein [Geomicrobium halophilum]
MEKKNVFLDDIRTCPNDHCLVRSAEDCIDFLKNHNTFGHISLDHDLGSKNTSGYAVVTYMIENHIYADRITIHSANATKGKRMYEALTGAKNDGLFPPNVQIYYRPLPLYSPASGGVG